MSYSISGLLAYAMGFRGFDLLFPAILVWFPVIVAMAFVDLAVTPPKVKPYHPDFVTLDLAHRAPIADTTKDNSASS